MTVLEAAQAASRAEYENGAVSEDDGGDRRQFAQASTGRRRLEEVRRLKHGADISSLAVSPDGSKFAAAFDFGRKVAVSEVASGRRLAEFTRAQAIGMRTLGFSADSRFVVTTPQDVNRKGPWAVGVWEAASGKLADQLPRPRAAGSAFVDTLQELHVSPDGQFVVGLAVTERSSSAPGVHRIAVCRLSSGQEPRIIQVRGGIVERPLAVSARNHLAVALATARSVWDPQELLILDIASGEKIGGFAAHRPNTRTLAWSPDGQFLLSGAGGLSSALDPKTGASALVRDDDPIRVWDPRSARLVRSVVGKYDALIDAAWSPDASLFVTSGAKSHDEIGGAIRLWNSANGELLAEERFGPRKSSGPVVFHPDGRHLITTKDADLVIYQIKA